MTDESYEVLCKPILDNLTKIEELVSAEDNDSIFDVSESAKTKDALSELTRIRRSLEQYMGRTGTLSYVGFLGHFSAGKTCTINSLIEEERQTGQNPTDSAITLITHESNSSNIIATHSHGELAIGRIFYDKPILRHTVIVDTPGSGDPSIVEEMVRDFLPICDRLIYTFSAASPLDSSDLPVLQKARSELPFIPITIVVTRADEFRIDSLQPLSPDNYDKESANNFKMILSMRLLKDVGGLAVSPEDILLIDNKTNFNIDKLKTLVMPDQELDSDHAIKLHSHKVTYYIRSTRRLRDFFVRYIDSKLEALQLFLSSAKNNHDVYQNKETMANSRLTGFWREAREELDREKSNQTTWVNNLETEINLTPQLLDAPSLKTTIDDITSYIDEYADHVATDICKKLRESLQMAYDDHITKFRRQLLVSDDSSSLKLTSIDVDFESFTDAVIADREIPFRLERTIKHLPRDASEFLHETLLALDSCRKRLGDRIKTKTFVKATRSIVEKSIDEIRVMLDGFLESVRLYRSAILAMNTRQLAEEAGIVTMIEVLEQSEIPSEKRDVWQNEIVSGVFPSWKQLVDDQDSIISSLADDLRTIKNAISEHRSNPSALQSHSAHKLLPTMDWLNSDVVVAGAIEESVHAFRSESEIFCAKINDQCEQTMEEENKRFIQDKRQIRELRKKRFKKYVYLPIALVLVATVIYYGARAEFPSNWASPMIVNFVSAILVGLISKAWDQSKIKIAKRAKRHIEKQRDVMESLIESNVSKFRWQFIDQLQPKIFTAIAKNIRSASDKFIRNNVVDPSSVLYDKLKELSRQLKGISASYINAALQISSELTEYYTRTEVNLAVLARVSAAIRQEEIEPSFVTLNERNKELGDRKNTLTGIEITLSST